MALTRSSATIWASRGRSPPRSTSAATRGVLRSVLDLIEGGATHLGVACDTVIESFRNDLWPGYKTGEGIEPVAARPVPRAGGGARGPRRHGLGHGRSGGRRRPRHGRGARGRRRAGVAGDHLHAGQGPVAVRARASAWCSSTAAPTPCATRPASGSASASAPASIPDYLALVGDSADGFPGLPGWGAKSAAALLARWGSIDAVPDDPADWDVTVRGAARLAGSLREGRRAGGALPHPRHAARRRAGRARRRRRRARVARAGRRPRRVLPPDRRVRPRAARPRAEHRLGPGRVGEALAQAFAFGVAVALSPFPIIGIVLILAAPGGRARGLAFLGGAVAGVGRRRPHPRARITRRSDRRRRPRHVGVGREALPRRRPCSCWPSGNGAAAPGPERHPCSPAGWRRWRRSRHAARRRWACCSRGSTRRTSC